MPYRKEVHICRAYHSVNSLAFSPDSQTLLSAAWTSGWFCELETGAESRRFSRIVYAVALAQTEKNNPLLVGDRNSGNYVWDAATALKIRAYVGHTSSSAACLQPGWAHVPVWLQRPECAAINVLNSGAEAERIQRSDGVEAVALSPDGQFALSGAVTAAFR